MIDGGAFVDAAREAGYDSYAGVPCSFLTPLINRVITAPGIRYVAAANEGDAVAIAAGAWLAGHKTVVMCQNSGLGNAVNPLTSLNWPFRIPTLLIVTWRGQPGITDEPQHALMGPITPAMLETMKVPHSLFPTEPDAVAGRLAAAGAAMERDGLPYAFVMQKGSVAEDGGDAELPAAPAPSGTPAGPLDLSARGPLATRYAAMERLLAALPDTAAIVATTGKCGRELFTIADREQHLYQVGSMGCASAMGLGVALNVDRPVVVLDGDGAALMRMGVMGTIGAYAPKNLIHIVLDNGTYDSTGGQSTTSASADFAGVASACGYPRAFRCDSLEGFERVVALALENPGPHLIHMRIAPGSVEKLGRPTIPPHEVARRFRDFLTRPA